MLHTKFPIIRQSEFQRRFLEIDQSKKKNCLWRPCLLMDRDEISNLYRAPSIDASYQVSVHLAEGFQRRRLKCEKLTADDGRQTTDAKWCQKLALPLARWAKKKNVFISIELCCYLEIFLFGPYNQNCRENVESYDIEFSQTCPWGHLY